MRKIIGIDLGTTNSAMAIVEGGEPKILENAEGVRTTPSIVAWKGNERLVGVAAKRQAVTNPKNTLFSIKRLIGHRYEDEAVTRTKKLVPFEIEKSGEGVAVKFGDKSYKPQEISAMVLQKLKADAEARLGEKVTEAVITVPAYFDDSQRQATKDAGKIAGLNVLRIINEPTAAALAYGFNKKKNEKIAVYDLGGGTFDVSILEVDVDEVGGDIKVIATNGDTHLGGDDFDQLIIEHIIEEFKKDQGSDLSKDIIALQRVKEAAERAKHELSTAMETEINQPYITQDTGGPKHLNIKLTRAKLEELVRPLIDKTLEPCRKAFKDAGVKPEDINEVILVGGQTRMPLVQSTVEKFFGKKPHIGVNPDEVVAIGAAVQAGIIQGDVKDVLLLDVTPLTLGIETLGGVRTPLIERNTTIPTSKSQTFSTAADNQTTVEIHVLQGEREMVADNKSLGKFILSGLPPAPRGVPQVEVTFDIDASGILKVTAKDTATGKSQNITITASTDLTDQQIEQMRKDATAHAEEDKLKKEAVEAANMAETLIYTAEKTLKEAGDKVNEADKKEVTEKIEALKSLKDKGDTAAIQKETSALSSALQKVGAAMYQKSQEENKKSEGAQAQDKGDHADQQKKDDTATVEADFEEVTKDENKKQGE
ncbi:MAG: Chaperone protein DnaK [Parcubacteria group bacterium GW2011_GWA2_44_12]|nr:MAG: Chaperone protein DnaK [Parcubacteria group bacterium GW2011_GWA2_44_12]